MARWTVCDWDDKATRPTVPGLYKVLIVGDSETEGAHVYYSYDDYETFATLYEPDEDGEQRFQGEHDEEPEQVLAWFGPIDIPSCDCFPEEGTQ
jgi:hypothetical protein